MRNPSSPPVLRYNTFSMNMNELIQHKKQGRAHSTTEIHDLVQGIVNHTVPDYQLAAWLMAICFKGMNETEVTALTDAIAHSGETLDLSALPGIKVDKHSTGGVGDKVTLVLAPLVASAGLTVAKLSGRGLGHTGGTIDKLDAIPGFNTSLTTEQFLDQLKAVGVAVAGQTQNLAPADKVLYALRDVTATVDSIPLIVSSVLSKKIAAGADVIVLDVKYGSGAFMPDYASARELAHLMVKVGQSLKRSVSVVLSDMEQPLGYAIGHTLEVEEALDTLKGHGPEDLTSLCLTIGAVQLVGAHLVPNIEAGQALLKEKLNNGAALAKFSELITAQGGDDSVIADYTKMPHGSQQIPLLAERDGYVHEVVALQVGHTLKLLGAARETKDDQIDLGVGIVLHKKRGDAVKKGEPLATLHVSGNSHVAEALQTLNEGYHLADSPLTESTPLIREIIWAP